MAAGGDPTGVAHLYDGTLLGGNAELVELPYAESTFFEAADDQYQPTIRERSNFEAQRELLEQTLARMNIAGDEAKAITSVALANSLGKVLSAPRQYEVVDQARQPQPTVSDFRVVPDGADLAGMLPDFDQTRFREPLTAKLVYRDLLGKLLREIPEAGNAAKRKIVSDELESIDLGAAVSGFATDLMRTSMIRTFEDRGVSSPLDNNNMIKAPILGSSAQLDSETLKLAATCARVPFSGAGSVRPLSYFLQVLFSIIYGKLNRSAAFRITLHVMSGEPHDVIKSQFEYGIPFASMWYSIQQAWSSNISVNDNQSKLDKLMKESVPSIGLATAKIFTYNSNIHSALPITERKIATCSQAKTCLLRYVATFYPAHSPVVVSSFRRISLAARASGQENTFQSYQALSSIAYNVIGSARPIKVSNVGILSVNELEVEEADQPQVEEVRAGPARGGNTGAKPKGLWATPAFQGRCFLCFSADGGHGWKNCPVYDQKTLGKVQCPLCQGLHQGRCQNETRGYGTAAAFETEAGEADLE